MTAHASNGGLQVQLSRQPGSHPSCTGPLPPAFRYVHASLLRCVFRLHHPALRLSLYPIGLLNHTAPLRLRIETGDAEGIAESLTAFAQGRGSTLLLQLESILAGTSPLELEFWKAEIETLQKFAARKKVPPVPQPAAPPLPLPLFPDL
jgi:hypothetical protein